MILEYFVLGSVLFFTFMLLLGAYKINTDKKDVESKLGGNIAIGWFIITLAIMSFEYYNFKIGVVGGSDSTRSTTYTVIDGWDD